MILDFFKYGISNLRKRKMRSWLTMIGIFVGMAAVVALVSLGQGLEKYIDDEFEKLGKNKIFIMTKGGYMPGMSEVKFTIDDLNEVDKVNGVTGVARMPFGAVEIKFNKVKKYAFGMGWPLKGEERKIMDSMFSSYEIEKGRPFRKGDKYKVILGHYYLDKELFDGNIKLGDKIEINGKNFDVMGFYEVIGNPQDDVNVYMPIDTYYEVLEKDPNELDSIYAVLGPNEDPAVVSERIEKALRKSRDVEEGKEDFTVQTPQEMLEAFGNVLLIIQIVLIGIAGISLFVGGIGIMNTMYTSVLERTKEIGIMKAIGARNRSILTLFLIESGTMGLLGGIMGVILGMGISKFVEIIATIALESALLKAYFPWYLIVGTLVFSFVIGSLSGVIPAYQASKLKPADSLRYE